MTFLRLGLKTLLVMVALVGSMSLTTLSTVHSAEGHLNQTPIVFGFWERMNVNSFCVDNSCAVQQCQESIGTVEELQANHCQILAEKLENGECDVRQVPDGTAYRWIRGRVTSNSAFDSKLTPNLIKKLGRYDRALRCDLGGNMIVDWFTGNDESCNNLAWLFIPPRPSREAEWICKMELIGDSGIRSDTISQLNSTLYQNSCYGEENYPLSYNFVMEDSLKSSGFTEVCGWE